MRILQPAFLLSVSSCLSTVHPRVGAGVPPPDWIEVEKLQPQEPGDADDATRSLEPSAISARHILIAYRQSAMAAPTVVRTKQQAKERAGEVVARLRAGDDFASLAKEYTDEPGGAERQGDLGRFTRDKMVKAFADAAFALRPGQLSDVVETQFGFHIIQRTE